MTRCHSTFRWTSSCSMPPTRGCGGSARSAAPAGVRSARSTSTTRRCSWRTPSPTRTRRHWRLRLRDRPQPDGGDPLRPATPRLRSPLPDPHRLGVAERADPKAGELTTVARPFDTAEPQLRVRHRHPVDEDLACLDVVDEAPLFG